MTPVSRVMRGLINRIGPFGLRIAFQRRTGSQLVRLGTSYGGWWVPAETLEPGAVAFTGGLGEDASFDLELCDHGLSVWAFDPTPKAIAYASKLQGVAGFTFVPVGWSDAPGSIRFYAPSDPMHASYSATNLQKTASYIEAEVDTVSNLARSLGLERVDLMKMDIEGLAPRVIVDILAKGPHVKCLCVEFDQPTPISETIRCLRRMRRAGFQVVKIEGWNVTLVRE